MTTLSFSIPGIYARGAYNIRPICHSDPDLSGEESAFHSLVASHFGGSCDPVVIPAYMGIHSENIEVFLSSLRMNEVGFLI